MRNRQGLIYALNELDAGCKMPDARRHYETCFVLAFVRMPEVNARIKLANARTELANARIELADARIELANART